MSHGSQRRRKNVHRSEIASARSLQKNAASLVEEIWFAPLRGHRCLESHLDDVLLWLGETRGRSASIIDQAGAASGYNRIELRDKALAHLDRVFLRYGSNPWEILGLDSDASIAMVKSRYRRFQKIFHPDRNGRGDGEFLHCSEQLNRAYSGIRKHRQNMKISSGFLQQAEAESWPGPAADQVGQHFAARCRQSKLMAGTRRRLGPSTQVRKQVFSVLILVSALMILLLAA